MRIFLGRSTTTLVPCAGFDRTDKVLPNFRARAVIEILIPVAGGLKLHLGKAQLFILQFQLDLMDL